MIKMKYLVFIALFLVSFRISHQDKIAETMIKHFFKTHEGIKNQCLAEANVDTKLENIFEDLGEIDDNENLRCFTKCILIRSGAINKAGEMFPENISTNMQFKDVSMANKLIEQCSDFDKGDLCKGAKQLIDCSFVFMASLLKP